MSTKPLFLLRKAKKSSGEPDVVLWASNDFESTCATLDYLIVKSGKKLSSYFKAVATNFPVVNDLPAEGEIDFTWSERYQLSKDSMTWELKPGAAPDNAHYQGNTNVNGEDMTEIEENMLLPISGQELPIRWLAQHGSEKPVTHVSRDGLQALHIARLKNYRLLLPWLFPTKPACSTRWKFANSTNWFVTLTKFSLILVIQTWD